jgi:hypothetical protein
MDFIQAVFNVPYQFTTCLLSLKVGHNLLSYQHARRHNDYISILSENTSNPGGALAYIITTYIQSNVTRGQCIKRTPAVVKGHILTKNKIGLCTCTMHACIKTN